MPDVAGKAVVRRMYDGGAVRHEPRDSVDDFPTPPWAVRALCEHVLGDCSARSVLEPACGRSHMARALAESFGCVHQSDLVAYDGADACAAQMDFLRDDYSHPACQSPEWIITNPPFTSAEAFATLALRRASVGVAIFARGQFLHAVGRYRRLFAQTPPHLWRHSLSACRSSGGSSILPHRRPWITPGSSGAWISPRRKPLCSSSRPAAPHWSGMETIPRGAK